MTPGWTARYRSDAPFACVNTIDVSVYIKGVRPAWRLMLKTTQSGTDTKISSSRDVCSARAWTAS